MKVAIITHYYNSKNYGGNLQAYALCKALNNLGLDAEQLSFDKFSGRKKRNLSAKGAVRLVSRCLKRIRNNGIKRHMAVRSSNILAFNKNRIPHSCEVYNSSTIAQCVNCYDAFITGSDQVWHPIAYCSAYGLEFVPSQKIKLSYAASIAADTITEEYRNILKKALADFRGVSVRECSAADILQDVVNQSIDTSLDPTLLLSREEWDLVSSGYKCDEAYMFCYFLGDSLQHRNLAKEYARSKGLRIVTLPYLLGNYRKCDKTFGDDKLYDISPEDFISLIKGAEVIFTDSFHAAVFSIIYEKEFVVFDRSITGSMGSRLSGLMHTLKLEERFCNTTERMTFQYVNSLQSICFNGVHTIIEELKEESMGYLKRCLFESKDGNKSN